jgi:exodeoxyribonuclease VII small subunit
MPKEQLENEQELGFEASLSALERIVAQLESGDLPLERALGIFEEGVGMARRCQEKLTEAERKVEMLLRERGEIKAMPFEPQREGEAAEEASSRSAAESHPIKTPPPRAKADDDIIPF